MGYAKSTKKSMIPLQAENPVVSFVKFARKDSKEEMKTK